MTIPAGVEPPAPDAFDDVGIVHAVDGDGTAFCVGDLAVEQVDHYAWEDVPDKQRCPVCAIKLAAVVG